MAEKKDKTAKVSKPPADKQIGAYNPEDIEKKWQLFWEDNQIYKAPDFPQGKKAYVLDMFPYPSAEGLHVGHPLGYTATDVYSRYLRANGYSVLHPMGWDAFGLPAENYALKTGVHPAVVTKKNIDRFREQIKSLGLSYDWSSEINTTDPGYYKWTQWIFLELYKKGLAYEADVAINWCPSCRTGLANEEVVSGKCDRCGTEVEKRKLRQWMLKITAYADRLIEGLDSLEWPDSIKRLQRDWIGRKEGAKVLFQVRGTDKDIEAFTTRVDTIFGVSYLALATDHPLIESIVTPAQAEAVKIYIAQAAVKNDREHKISANDTKTGVFTGAYAINPLTSEEVPVWISDYVLTGVGTGAVMGVPGHDARDYDFARAHDLAIKGVVCPEDKVGERAADHDDIDLPYEGEGILVESGGFSGMHSEEARKTITDYLERHGDGEKAVSYKLRDWVFSRQRYWGEPIPLVHCTSCGIVPVLVEQLPVKLPEVEKYEPTGTGESPLSAMESWVNTECPKCNQPAKRETNTMPQWAGSCWYYLRFIDPHNDKQAWDPKKEKAWMQVDVYVGGAEHAVLHLLYARFWHKVLFDLGHVSTDEPFKSLRNQGMILGPDGQKMSKSRGNVLNPDDIVKEHGADTLRVYEMFMGPFDESKPWSTESVAGINRFLKRVWSGLGSFIEKGFSRKSPKELEERLQVVVNKVTEDIENFKFNTAIASLMEFSRTFSDSDQKVSKRVASIYLVLLSAFAPHIAEELWRALGNKKSIQLESWPERKEVKVADEIDLAVQVNGKHRDTIKISATAVEDDAIQIALSSSKVSKYVNDISLVKKIIYVPGRILNFVIPGK